MAASGGGGAEPAALEARASPFFKKSCLEAPPTANRSRRRVDLKAIYRRALLPRDPFDVTLPNPTSRSSGARRVGARRKKLLKKIGVPADAAGGDILPGGRAGSLWPM